MALLRLSLLLNLKIVAIHCNFHLRGEESDRDAEFVENLCRNLNVELIRIDFDTLQYINDNPGISTEMACRELRHNQFDMEAAIAGCARIVTGHNASDNAETLFLNLLRGSGIAGLKGMLPDDGRIIRPLITSTRNEILSFLHDLNQKFITDSTNLQSDFRRNFLRNDIFPLLKKRWAGLDKSLARSIRILQRQNKILEYTLSNVLGEDKFFLSWEKINSFIEPVTLLHRFILPFGGTENIAEEISRSLPFPHAGKHWVLNSGELYSEREGLRFIPAGHDSTKNPIITWETCEITDENREEFISRIRNNKENKECWLPLDEDAYEFRFPYPAERFAPLGMKGTRLCSDIISEAHLSTDIRKDFKLLALRGENGKPGEAIWLPGLKRSRRSLIDFNCTNRIYCCRITYP